MSSQNIKKIREILLTFNSDKIFTDVDGILIVNLDKLTNREYQFEGVNEFLYQVSSLGKNKILLFLIRDGANLHLTGVTSIINKTIEILNLTKDTCYVFGHSDNLKIKNVTEIYYDITQVWIDQIYPYIKELPISSDQFTKKFAGLFGRHDLYRLKLCRYLHERYLNDSILSYNASRLHWNQRFEQEFKDDTDWFKKNCPIFLDSNVARNWLPYQESMITISNWYNEYFIEIVSETDPYNNQFFTEKTLKNFFLGKPFLLFSDKNSLQHLHTLGYQTFSPWIDETYDLYSGFNRLQFIFKEIDRLANMPIDELRNIYQQLNPILLQNRLLFIQIGEKTIKTHLKDK